MAEKKPKPELPLSLRAGNIQPMEGMAAPKPAEYYVGDCAYIGYPLIPGQRVFVMADGGKVRYQDDRQVIPAPDVKIDEVFAKLYEEVGTFVLEGMMVYRNTTNKGCKSRTRENEENRDEDNSVWPELHVYRALYLKEDLRPLTEYYRNMVAGMLVKLTDHKAIRIVDALINKEEKGSLLRGFAIWVLRDARYRPGLDERRQSMVYNAPF